MDFRSDRDAQQLARVAEQLERVAPFMCRADSRFHALERAAKLRAETALIEAARYAARTTQKPQAGGETA